MDRKVRVWQARSRSVSDHASDSDAAREGTATSLGWAPRTTAARNEGEVPISSREPKMMRLTERRGQGTWLSKEFFAGWCLGWLSQLQVSWLSQLCQVSRVSWLSRLSRLSWLTLCFGSGLGVLGQEAPTSSTNTSRRQLCGGCNVCKDW